MSLILGKTEKVGIKTADGVVIDRFYPIKAIAEIPGAVKDAFLEHNYDLNGLPGTFIKIFTLNERELGELMNTLDEIDRLDLKEVFNTNLELRYFKKRFLERVKYCVNNNIPFLNQDNTFASFLNSEEAFSEYRGTNKNKDKVQVKEEVIEKIEEPVKKIVPEESNVVSMDFDNLQSMIELDSEDNQVYNEIKTTLEQIKETKQDGSIKFIVDSAISNLGDVIARDSKQYKDAGIGSLVRKATRGVALTPEMEMIINDEILVAFPENNIGKGMVA